MANFQDYINILKSGIIKPRIKIEWLRPDETVESEFISEILDLTLNVVRNNGVRRTLQFSVKNESYLLNRSACYLKTGDDVLAVEDISALFKLGLKSSRAYSLKVEGLRRMGKNDLATNFLEEGLKSYPQDSKLLKLKQN